LKILVRGKWLFAGSGTQRKVIRDGALYVEDDIIRDLGKYRNIAKNYHFDVKLGSENSVVMPGFINAHHHGKGISTLQRGVVDEPLETRLLSYYEHKGDVDTYDDAILAAVNEIESGITSILHHHYGVEPMNSKEYRDDLDKVAKAWADSGLRVAIAPFVEDQDEGGVGMIRALEGKNILPRRLGHMKDKVSGDEKVKAYFETFPRLAKFHGYEGRIKILLGPTGPQWCTDQLLQRVKMTAHNCRTGIHTHLVETKYQQEYGFRVYGKSQVEHLDELGFLGPEVSCAHSVWLTEKDIDILAKTKATAVHNLSSNLRLFSGMAPILRMKEKGVNVALGTDALGIDDDEDFFQEMRLNYFIHRKYGIEATKLSSNQILDMATIAGSRAILQEGATGALKEGMKADIIILNSERIFSPSGIPQLPAMDLIVSRARSLDVDTVIVNGKILMRNRRLMSINKNEAMEKIKKGMARRRRRRGELKELKTWIRNYFSKFKCST